MKKIALAFISLVAMVSAVSAVPQYALAADPAEEIRKGVTASGGAGQRSLGDQIKLVVNVLLFILGAIAVIMIVIGGIRYTTSNGDSGSITSAKNTILYAVVGLIVALLAYSIVNFVLISF